MNRRDRTVPSETSRLYAKYGAIGLQFSLTLVVFIFGGVWLDQKFDSSPWLTLLGAFLGFFGGTLSIALKVFPPKPKSDPPAKQDTSSSE